MANWDMIRTEVKTLDRKVDALLASTDPGDFRDGTLTLVAAYPFHRGKLNEPKVKAIIEDAVERTVQQRVAVRSVLHDELATLAPPPPSSNGGGAPPDSGGNGGDETSNGQDDGEDVTASVDHEREMILARAMAIFEAEEIPPEALPGFR